MKSDVQKQGMTPERRREVCALVFFMEVAKRGVDLRKWRRDVGTQAEELGISIPDALELMKVATGYALNSATENQSVDPWTMTVLSRDQIYGIAEQAVDSLFVSGKMDFCKKLGSVLQKRGVAEEQARILSIIEVLGQLKKVGVSAEELLELFEGNFRKFAEMVLTKVKETITVAIELSSKD